MEEKIKTLSQFFYEIGTLKKILRAHQQALLEIDPTDNISSHSFRASFMGYFLAKELSADSDKVLKMCLLHDIEEVRSGDMNWINKKYVKVFEDEIRKDQLECLPYSEEFLQLSKEYSERQSKEAKVAKDADLLEQVFSLKEYAQKGNKEAEHWLHENGDNCQQVKLMNFDFTKNIAKEAIKQTPSDWWEDVWTPKNR